MLVVKILRGVVAVAVALVEEGVNRNGFADRTWRAVSREQELAVVTNKKQRRNLPIAWWYGW